MNREGIERFVREWAPRLGLSHWRITVDWSKPIEKGSIAGVDDLDTYEQATMRFAANYETWTAEWAEWTVVHELMHLVTRDLDNAVGEITRPLPAPARTMARRLFEHELEGVVDKLARILVGAETGVHVKAEDAGPAPDASPEDAISSVRERPSQNPCK